MSHTPNDPRAPIDVQMNSPGREGLTGTAPADRYAPNLDPEDLTVAPDFRPRGQSTRVAPGFPDRLAAGRLRGQARFHEVHDLDERRIRRRPTLDRGSELVAEADGQVPGIVRIASVDDVEVGGHPGLQVPRRPRCLRARSHRRRPNGWPTARSARTCRAPSSRSRRTACSTAPATKAISTSGRAAPPPVRRPGRCRESCSRCAGATFTRPGSR